MVKANEHSVANVVTALREAGRPMTASDLIGKPYAARTSIIPALMEAERRGLVRKSRESPSGRIGAPKVLWEVCDA